MLAFYDLTYLYLRVTTSTLGFGLLKTRFIRFGEDYIEAELEEDRSCSVLGLIRFGEDYSEREWKMIERR